MKLTVRSLTPDLWPALEDLFGKNGACGGCWCMYWRIGSSYRKRRRGDNKAAFRAPPDNAPRSKGDRSMKYQVTCSHSRDLAVWLRRPKAPIATC